MAQLADSDWLMQQYDGIVTLFHRHTEQVLLTFNPFDPNDAAKAQGRIAQLEELDEEQKASAHFWSGYFYHAAVR